jgi:hypothetical protein
MLANAFAHASQMLAARQIRMYRVASCLLRGNDDGHDLLAELTQRHAAGQSLQQLADWLRDDAIDELILED